MNPLKLPSDWDLRRDLLVLLGKDAGELATALRARGQARLFVVAEEAVAGLPDDVPCVASPSALLYPIVATQGACPQRVVVHSTAAEPVSSERRDAVVRATREALRARKAQHLTLDRNGATWLDQGLGNLSALARFPAVTSLYGKFGGRTAFVCAPGPSLSEALPHLRAQRDGCLIISVSHALHSLAQAGIVPDVVLAADPGNLDRHFAGVDTRAVGALVIAATGRPCLFEVPARAHFHFAGNGRTDDWLYAPLGVDARLATGGSVACSAASLALLLGCQRVVFCGLDLSFPGGRFYAQESLDGDARVQEQDGQFFLRKEAGASGSGYSLPDGGLRFSADQRVETIRAVGGGSVSTSPAMRLYLTWFETLAADIRARAVLVQTSRDGAYIRGFTHGSIAAEAANAAAGGPSFADVAQGARVAHDAGAAAARLRAHFQDVQATLPLVATLARDLANLAGRVAREPALLPQVKQGERQLRAALQPLGLLVIAAHGDLRRAENEARASSTLADDMRAVRRIFGAVERAVRTVQSPLDSGLARLVAQAPGYVSDAAGEVVRASAARTPRNDNHSSSAGSR